MTDARTPRRGGRNPPAPPFPVVAQGRVTEFPLRILVSSEMVGAIIGRGGATIRNITQATRARVDVHRKENIGSVEKAITIYGSPENISQACKKILEVMSQEATSTNKGEISLKVLAHNSLIGRIIGKGGTTIKKIMEETGTKINVSSLNEVSGLNIERVISIRGSIDGMSAAEALISSKLKASYENDLQVNALSPLGNAQGSLFPGLHPMAMMSSLRAPMPHPAIPSAVPPYPLFNLQEPRGKMETETVQLYIPNNSVGAIIGTKGSYIRNIIRFSSASVKIATVQGDQKVEEKEATREVTIIGTAEAQWKAQCMIFEKIREEGFVPANEEPKLTVEISVPSNQVGRIIGKGGSNVRELQRLTEGAIIKFPSESSSNGETTNVHIIGTFFSSQSAQRRIRAMLNSARSQ